MRSIENEQNIDILKQFISLQDAAITQLTERLNQAANTNLNSDQIRINLEDKLLKLKKEFILKGREKLSQNRPKESSPGGVLLHSQGLAPQAFKTEHPKLDAMNTVYGYELNEFNEVINFGDCGHSHGGCPKCGGILKLEKGLTERTTEITVYERRYIENYIDVEKYKCGECYYLVSAEGPRN